jgi:hypothetical protein
VAAGAIDERISELVAAHHQELAELVRQAVDRELQSLVAAELEHRNGNGSRSQAGTLKASQPGTLSTIRPEVVSGDSAETVKVCNRCGETKPTTDFEAGRRTCRSCRWRQQRQREDVRAAADAEADRPDAGDLA